MAEVKFNKGSEEWMMFTDYWQLCQKYWEVEEDNDKYWEDLTKEVINFPERHGGDKFAVALALAFIDSQMKKQEELKERRQYSD